MSLDAFTVNAIIVGLALPALLMGVVLTPSRDTAARLAALERQVSAPPPASPPKGKAHREPRGQGPIPHSGRVLREGETTS